ncbi:phage portal protein, partial [bacterium]|nr:phage portal protein [bacterium]
FYNIMSKHINKYRKPTVAKKKDSKISFVNLSTYSSPKIVESKSKEWVEFGADNNYFQFLIDRYNGSPTNSAVINAISQMIFGKGLDATNSSKKPEQYALMISLFKKDVVRRLSYDLKLAGQCAIQVIYSKDKKTIQRVEHLPVETLRAEKCSAEDKKIQAYYYHPDWANAKPSDEPKRIPAFGVSDSPQPIEILYVKPYKAGMYYYSTPDYQGGLQYAELEEEVSNYHLNNILNGLAPSMLINFNNGIPDENAQTIIENKIKNKFSGSSNAGKFILAFNDDKESAADITPVQLSDAHNQYQFLSEESQKKIMVSHRVVSPMLLGVKDSSGLGNNADELKTATILMDNTVIRPFQELLIDAFDQILAFNGISLNLYFKTLQPLEFTDLDNVKDQETREEETGVKMAKQNEGFEDSQMLDALEGEEIDEEWELVDTREYSEENENIEDWAKSKIKEKLSIIQKLANVVTSKPNGFSYLDKSFYKVRYKYSEKYSSKNSRDFCKTMMKRTAKGVVYRLEDIDQASAKGVNEKFGHKKQAYDLFKYKGGVQCGHVWSEQLYRLKKKTEKGANQISKYDETDSIPSTYKPKPRGSKESKIAPKDMPNDGHHPNYNK